MNQSRQRTGIGLDAIRDLSSPKAPNGTPSGRHDTRGERVVQAKGIANGQDRLPDL